MTGIPAVGTVARRSRTLSHADIALFAELTGDRNPLHLDAELAARTRFGGIIVQGGVTSGLLNAVVAEDLPGPGTVFLHVDWSFRAPGRPGHTVTAEVEVLDRRPDKPVGTLRTTVTDEDGTVLIDGTAVVYREPLPTAEQLDPHCLTREQAGELLAGAPWQRLAVVGDSLAEGLGDPVDGYRNLPWSERLTEALRPAAHVNLGVRALTAAEICARQLPAALAFRPDLAIVSAGANDMLRVSFDPAAVGAELDAILGALTRQGALVVTFGLFDLSRANSAGDPRLLRRRIEHLNRVTRTVTERHHGLHVDFFEHPVVEDALLSADLVHPNRRGHARIATQLVRSLAPVSMLNHH